LSVSATRSDGSGEVGESDPRPAVTGFSLRRDGLLLALVLACVAFAQWPPAGSYFRGDDFAHLYEIENHGWLEFLLRPQGAHSLIVSYSLLAMCWELFGMRAEAWYALPLAIHLANTALLYRLLVRESTGSSPSRFLAAGIALWWGVCPIHQGTLGWLSASCQATGTMWLLLLFGRLSRLRESSSPPAMREQLGWCALALCAAASFGTALAVAAVAGPIAMLLLWDVVPDVRRPAIRTLSLLLLVIPILYFFQLLVFSQVWPDPIGAVVLEAHGQSLQLEQLPSSLRMLFRLVAYAVTATLLGGAVAMNGKGALYGPWAGASPDAVGSVVLVAVALVSVLVIVTTWRVSGSRGRIAAVILSILACYAPIALARAYFYEMMTMNSWLSAGVPRYHYLGTLLVAWLLFAMIDALWRNRSQGIAGLAAFATVLVLALGFQAPASDAVRSTLGFKNARARVEAIRGELERLALARPAGAIVAVENRIFPSAGWKLDRYTYPGMAALFMVMYPIDEIEGRRIVFVDDSDGARALVRARPDSRIARLLVTRQEADAWTLDDAR
jgi:hypothetical protein